MARARSPNRDKAFELWRDSGGNKPLKDIAHELGLSDGQVRKWKNNDRWEEQLNGNSVTNRKGNVTIAKSNVTIQNCKNKIDIKKKSGAPKGNQNAKGHGAPKGNKNAVGNKGGPPLGSQNALRHGFFAKILPDDAETREIIESIDIKSPIEILWENIVLQYGVIARAQKIMFVRNQDDLTKVLKREKQTNGKGGSGWEEEYELQFAWDKQATLLKAQSAAMKTLEAMLARYDEMMRSELATEEQRVRIEKLRAEININKAKLLLEVEKSKGDNKSNQHADALRKKMAERKIKNGSS